MASETRRGKWLPLVYYYLATVIGLAILLFGLIGGLNGLVRAAFPKVSDELIYREPPFDERGRPLKVSAKETAAFESEAIDRARRRGFSEALDGLVATVVAGPVFFWHLRQARRREPEWLGLGGRETSEESAST